MDAVNVALHVTRENLLIDVDLLGRSQISRHIPEALRRCICLTGNVFQRADSAAVELPLASVQDDTTDAEKAVLDTNFGENQR